MRPESRDDAHDPGLVETLDKATGVFMTGGNQLKLSSIVCGTPLGDAIVAARDRGAVVAGTSAGASIQSSHMVAFGTGGATAKQRMTQVAAGLGLVRSAVIDQHFDQRNRYGRLLMIVAQSPQLLGIGVDEDTCAMVTSHGEREVLTVLGRGRGHDLRPGQDDHQRLRGQAVQPAARERRGAPHAARRRAVRPDRPHADPGRGARRPRGRRTRSSTAQRDLRQLARDIAAGRQVPDGPAAAPGPHPAYGPRPRHAPAPRTENPPA